MLKSKLRLICLILPLWLLGCSSTSPSDPALLSMTAEEREAYLHQLAVHKAISSLKQKFGKSLEKDLAKVGLSFPVADLKLIVLKDQKLVEVWGRDTAEKPWIFYQSYPMTGFSGGVGPKLREGDRQIPEGIYSVPFLNPHSDYHLSIAVDYPNTFDVIQAMQVGRADLGGDIFLHGGASTIGCVPLGDDNIEVLFYLVGTTGVENTGIIIAPYDLRLQPVRNMTSLAWVDRLYFDVQRAMLPFQHQ